MTEDAAHNQTDKLIGTIAADRYEIIARLGQGAMGTVYKAKHTGIGRFFALKTLNAHIAADERSLKRFEAEARAMSVLTHPNLIQISDYGKTADGIPFFVMEYLDGISLSERLAKNGPLPLEQAVPLFAQIADALEHAHAKSLIHRDLKPGNIMLIGENLDFPKVVDLGIAKLVTEGLGKESQNLQLTMTGEIFGSPLYMSPEQCQGLPLDARSDVYSLGCVMYEALSGRPPFKGRNVAQTVYQHMHETASRITYLSEEMSALILQCLAKEPELRPPSMAAVRDRLRSIAGKASTPATNKSTVRAPQARPDDATMVQRPNTAASGAAVSAAAASRSPASGEASGATTNGAPKGGSSTAQPGVSKTFVIIGSCVALLSAGLLIGAVALAMMLVGVFGRNTVAPQTGWQPRTQQQQVAEYAKMKMDTPSPLFERDNAAAPQELDVVGVYTAQPPSELLKDNDGEPAEITAHDLEVVVQPKDKPITLVLLSYFPVNWKIKAMPGANVQKVIASGYFEQKVEGVHCQVDTHFSILGKEMTHDDKAVHTANIFVTYDPDANRKRVLRDVDKVVKELIGPQAEMRRFKGRYYGTSFDI